MSTEFLPKTAIFKNKNKKKKFILAFGLREGTN